MREIKFRAWIEGYRDYKSQYVYFGVKDIDGGCIRLPDRDGLGYHYQCLGCKDEVEHPTIEQYTGLRDKNEKEIYEGDIVALSPNRNDVVTFSRFPPYWLENEGFGYEGEGLEYPETCEVIGNIHESPELLEAK